MGGHTLTLKPRRESNQCVIGKLWCVVGNVTGLTSNSVLPIIITTTTITHSEAGRAVYTCPGLTDQGSVQVGAGRPPVCTQVITESPNPVPSKKEQAGAVPVGGREWPSGRVQAGFPSGIVLVGRRGGPSSPPPTSSEDLGPLVAGAAAAGGASRPLPGGSVLSPRRGAKGPRGGAGRLVPG